jgi:hypothetical protein
VGRFKKQKARSSGYLVFLKLFDSFPVIPGGYVSGITGRNQNPLFLGCFRVDGLVTKQQGRLDPRGGLRCFWCPNKTGASPVGASDTLTIVENRLEMRKFWSSRVVKGVKNSKKTNHQTLQRLVSLRSKTSLHVSLLLLEFKDDL